MISVLPLDNQTEDDSSRFDDYIVPERNSYGAATQSQLLK